MAKYVQTNFQHVQFTGGAFAWCILTFSSMTWSHVIITTSPNEQLLSNPWPLAKSKVLYRWWIKKCHTPIWSLQNLVKKFSHTAQCTAQWLQHVPSHPWRLVYTQIHHARRQVAPLFRHQKNYSILLLSEIRIISLMATKHWVTNCFAILSTMSSQGHPPHLDFEGFVAMMDRPHHQS